MLESKTLRTDDPKSVGKHELCESKCVVGIPRNESEWSKRCNLDELNFPKAMSGSSERLNTNKTTARNSIYKMKKSQKKKNSPKKPERNKPAKKNVRI